SLRLLATGTGQDGTEAPAIDIVAVHGLNPLGSSDHAFNTWRKPLHEEGCLWLRDCFAKAQPNARIYLYEYNSIPVFGSAKDSFVAEANQLLDEIYGPIEQLPWAYLDLMLTPLLYKKRDIPIILIGHSLGGILIKQVKAYPPTQHKRIKKWALVNAWANEKYRGIKEATHALVFFGTPHSGPARNMQIGLGMACARIARSLPFVPSSKIIEILEGEILFSDLLSESFRHQLNQYKILSCYEASVMYSYSCSIDFHATNLVKVVPFSSAVLGLPGNCETQLRINADHSNMCRSDMTIQADVDNYRKVERNL
ncbi:Ankyrin repeat protein, partial [Aspergillus sclerotialis]